MGTCVNKKESQGARKRVKSFAEAMQNTSARKQVDQKRVSAFRNNEQQKKVLSQSNHYNKQLEKDNQNYNFDYSPNHLRKQIHPPNSDGAIFYHDECGVILSKGNVQMHGISAANLHSFKNVEISNVEKDNKENKDNNDNNDHWENKEKKKKTIVLNKMKAARFPSILLGSKVIHENPNKQ